MSILDDLAVKYRSDKSSKYHNFTKYYDMYFSSQRQSVEKILEIGVHEGASVKMWKDYFPNSTVYGIDISNACRVHAGDRINIFIGDQSDDKFLDKISNDIGSQVDIIIDDGSHKSSHQIFSFTKLFPLVKSGGIYVVEDVTTSYWGEFDGGLKKQGTCIEFFKDRIDDIYFSGYKCGGNSNVLNPDRILKDKKDLTFFEESIESIHFYSGLIFIKRR